jgi:hypothetical protein
MVKNDESVNPKFTVSSALDIIGQPCHCLTQLNNQMSIVHELVTKKTSLTKLNSLIKLRSTNQSLTEIITKNKLPASIKMPIFVSQFSFHDKTIFLHHLKTMSINLQRNLDELEEFKSDEERPFDCFNLLLITKNLFSQNQLNKEKILKMELIEQFMSLNKTLINHPYLNLPMLPTTHSSTTPLVDTIIKTQDLE